MEPATPGPSPPGHQHPQPSGQIAARSPTCREAGPPGRVERRRRPGRGRSRPPGAPTGAASAGAGHDRLDGGHALDPTPSPRRPPGPARAPTRAPTGPGPAILGLGRRRADWTPPDRPGRASSAGSGVEPRPVRPAVTRRGRPGSGSASSAEVRRGHRQGVGRGVGGPHLQAGARSPLPSTASDRAMAPDPVPRSTQTGWDPPSVPRAGVRSADPLQLAQCDLHHLLGLGPGDQHPPVDRQFERPERPAAEHVLQGLAGRPAVGQGRGPIRSRRARRSTPPPGVEPTARRSTPPGRPIGDRPAGRRTTSLPHGRSPAGRPAVASLVTPAGGTACRPSGRRSTRRGRPSGSGPACRGSARSGGR